jgi:hypothetical protein
MVLDDNGYLFITDSFNDRIVDLGLIGFRCTYMNGSAFDQLFVP